jgi:hypothetical protein
MYVFCEMEVIAAALVAKAATVTVRNNNPERDQPKQVVAAGLALDWLAL